MTNARRLLIVVSITLAASAAQAQTYGQSYGYAPEPLYPYAVPGQSQGYGYSKQYAPRAYPYVRPQATRARASAKIMQAEPREDTESGGDIRPRPKRTSAPDPSLIEELRARGKSKYVDGKRIDKVIYKRGKPIVVTNQRVVDDPPIVVTRNHVVDVPVESAADPSRGRGLMHARPQKRGMQAHADEGAPRVIRAEAEVHILGPDRMSIKLFRRGTSAPVDLAND
ncbi:MAG: hypothetical protein JOZ70_11265 [Pseudolabrys sp.]|nr:hypothetical protein [Pseudolabrys sp.]MBV9955819.1 hypothetical protein [Pseudolabrys sp.]